MRGFLYKDFVLSKTNLIIMSVFTAFCVLGCFFAASSADEGFMKGVMIFAAFFLNGMLNMGFFGFDERRAWYGFAASCPSSYRGQAASKYILIFILNLVLLLIFAVVNLIVPLADGETRTVGSAFTTPVVFFSIQTIMNAIELPFLSRFGSQKGVNIKLIFLGSIIFIIGVYFLFGDISVFFEEDFLDALNKFISSGRANLITAFLPIAAIVLYFLSYLISAAVYRKGTENYEE